MGEPSKYVCQMNAEISALKSEAHQMQLRFPALDQESLRILVYSDAGFGIREDGSSQIGYAIFLVDDSGKAALLGFKSQKSARVVRSSVAGETLAFTAAYDAAFVMTTHNLLNYGFPCPHAYVTGQQSTI